LKGSTVTSIPPPVPRHTWADLLTLVGDIRRLAFGPIEGLGRIRDAIREYDGVA
jgi:hypothetical protein